MKKIFLLLGLIVLLGAKTVFAASFISMENFTGRYPVYFPTNELLFDDILTSRDSFGSSGGMQLGLEFFVPYVPHKLRAEILFSTENDNPKPGTYSNAINWFDTDWKEGPGFYLTMGSNALAAGHHTDFEIFEVEYDLTGNAIKFAADFRYYGVRTDELGYGLNYVGKVRYNSDYEANAVPEPATMMLFGAGLIGAFFRRKFVV